MINGLGPKFFFPIKGGGMRMSCMIVTTAGRRVEQGRAAGLPVDALPGFDHARLPTFALGTMLGPSSCSECPVEQQICPTSAALPSAGKTHFFTSWVYHDCGTATTLRHRTGMFLLLVTLSFAPKEYVMS